MKTARISQEALQKIRGAFTDSLAAALDCDPAGTYHTNIRNLAQQRLDESLPVSVDGKPSDLPPPATIAAIHERLNGFGDTLWGNVKGEFGKRGSGDVERSAIFGAVEAARTEAENQAELSASPAQRKHAAEVSARGHFSRY